MKPQDIQAGHRFKLPGNDTVYEALSEPRPYVHGPEGDVVIEVRWNGETGMKEDEIAFSGRTDVRRVVAPI